MATLKWTKVSPLPDPTHGIPCARSSHGISVLRNGDKLILYGGENVARTPLQPNYACWAVDFLSDSKNAQWRQIDCSSGSPPARVAHAQVATDDKVHIFGGRAGIEMNEAAMNDLWVLDCSGKPGSERWTQIEQKGDFIPEARSFHRMIRIDGSAYLFGGCGSKSGRLADLCRLDLETQTWHSLGTSKLRGRGGPNLIPLSSGSKVGIVAGFAGEETSDGHVYNLDNGAWEPSLMGADLDGLRPRSVCVSASFPSIGVSVIFGGEVDPSQKGHEGAGGFASDLVLLDEKTGALKLTEQPRTDEPWPENRGWSDGAAIDNGDGTGHLFLFGGLSGDDSTPRRLDDLWRLDIQKK